MRKWLIAGALLVAATPAMAGWGKTNWGMTPEQVIATVPGAVAVKPSSQTDMAGLRQFAEAPALEGKVKLTAGFFFAPDADGLRLVDIVADDEAQCDDFRKALVARLGPGKKTLDKLDIRDRQFVQLSIEWTDPETHDRLYFVGVLLDDTQKNYGLCKLMHWGPE